MTVPNPVIISSSAATALEAFKSKYSSAVVGLLACQLDSYLKTLSTKVVACREISPTSTTSTTTNTNGDDNSKPKNGKKKNDSKKSTPVPESSSTPLLAKYEVELEDTILFPEGDYYFGFLLRKI